MSPDMPGIDASAHDLRLLEAVYSTDDLTAVVVSQTYVEYYLFRRVQQGLSKPEQLGKKGGGLQFRHLMPLAVALDMVPAEWVRPMVLLSEMRNDFAHSIAHRVTAEEVHKLRDSLPLKVSQTVNMFRIVVENESGKDKKATDDQLELRGIMLSIAFGLASLVRQREQADAAGISVEEHNRLVDEEIQRALGDASLKNN